jgi:hypothetical protein
VNTTKPQEKSIVSIVINNFNYGEYLADAIESALCQTHPGVEVVVVDDGSTDNSHAIIAYYADRIVAHFQNNCGQAAAYNAGFARCGGDIVLFLDADDTLRPDAAAAVVAAWDGDVAKAQFPLLMVDQALVPTGTLLPNLAFEPGRELELVRHYGYYPAPPGSGNAFARTFLEHMLPLDEQVWRLGADGLLVGAAPFFGRIVTLDRPLGSYRVHGRNVSENGGIDLPKLRRMLVNETEREAVVKRLAIAAGEPIRKPLSLAIPGHCKARLISLKLDRAGHPYPRDTVASLTWAGIVAAWRFPHISWRKSLTLSLGFPMLALLSPPVLSLLLDALILPGNRMALVWQVVKGVAPSDGVALAKRLQAMARTTYLVLFGVIAYASLMPNTHFPDVNGVAVEMHIAAFALLALLARLGAAGRRGPAATALGLVVFVFVIGAGQLVAPGHAPSWQHLLADLAGVPVGVAAAERIRGLAFWRTAPRLATRSAGR